jgi:hypothetical protein
MPIYDITMGEYYNSAQGNSSVLKMLNVKNRAEEKLISTTLYMRVELNPLPQIKYLFYITFESQYT